MTEGSSKCFAQSKERKAVGREALSQVGYGTEGRVGTTCTPRAFICALGDRSDGDVADS